MISTIRTISRKISRLIKYIYYKNKLGRYGLHSDMDSPLRLMGAKNIFVEDYVEIHYKAWLSALPLTGKEPVLRIGEGSVVGDFSHIFATESIVIGKNVLIANNVYISDNSHGYEDISTPIYRQTVRQLASVTVGDNSWLGEHVAIMGASIGRHCIIGANSVVTRDIPDYSIAVGSPAKIIKRYDFETETWRRTDSNGKFID